METAITATPERPLAEARDELRAKVLNSLYVFCKAGLSMHDLYAPLHKRMADHMSNATSKRKLTRASRGHLKTSVGTKGNALFEAFRFLEGLFAFGDETEQEFLIVCSTSSNARRFGRDMKTKFESGSILRWLFPNIVTGPEWSKEVMMLDYVVDGQTLRRIIIEFVGVGGRVSSRHFHRIFMDDLHAAEEGDESPPSVREVVHWYQHSDALLIEPGRNYIYVHGTPCSLNPPDVYLYIEQNEKDAYTYLDIGCYGDDGEPVWPARFPKPVLEAIRRKQGDEVFARDYLVKYIDASIVELSSKDLVRYQVVQRADQHLYILENGRRLTLDQMFVTATVDLAGWRNPIGDENAIAIIGRTTDELNLILEGWRKRCPPDEFIAKLFEFHKQYHFYFVGVEEVALQELFSYYFEKAIEKEQLALRVVPVKPGRADTPARIRAMQPLFRSRNFAISDGMTQFLEEYTTFPKGKDHILAALSYQPKVWQTPVEVRMEEVERRMYREYLQSRGIQEATT